MSGVCKTKNNLHGSAVVQLIKLIPTEVNCCCLVIRSCLTLCHPVDCSPQAPLSIGLPRQGFGSGLPLPSSGDLPDLGIEPATFCPAGRFFTTDPLGFPGGSHGVEETWVQSLSWEDPEEGMATHSSTLAWRIPWTEGAVGYSPRGGKESDTTE